jgi:hypothetical protein
MGREALGAAEWRCMTEASTARGLAWHAEEEATSNIEHRTANVELNALHVEFNVRC